LTRGTICVPPSRWTLCLDEVITEPWAAVEDWVLRANPGMPITAVLLLRTAVENAEWLGEDLAFQRG
jgi:hypothetical protein